jgi:hypothetical protein
MAYHTSTYETLKWVKNLFNLGHKTYLYSDLPDDLKSTAYHRKAISKGYVRKIDTIELYGSYRHVWEIRPDILTLSSNTSKR